MRKLILIICLFASLFAASQTFTRFDPKVIEDNVELKFPFTGGMNLPQTSQGDLNHDGKADLFIHDRVGGKLMAFIYDENVPGKYKYEPEWLKYFPKTINWAQLYDYNKDGVPDLFSYSTYSGIDGISVFRGYWVNDTLHFKQLSFKGSPAPEVLPFTLGNGSMTNIYVTNSDVPTLEDMDDDGDLDILSYDSGGGYINYYKNNAIENGLGLDSLYFTLGDQCWGKIFESGFSAKISLSPTPDNCATPFNGGIEVRHIGSTTLAVDLDKDGDKDVLVGDVSFPGIIALYNGGNKNKAYVTSQDTSFPSYDIPVVFPDFPAAFKVDLFLDNKIALLFSPNNSSSVSEDRNVMQLYQSPTGNFTDIHKIQNDYLVNDMIDVGSGAHPAFMDIDGDGDQDMIIGSFSYYTDVVHRSARLFLYENTGSAANPVFTLVDSNYLNFKQFQDTTWGLEPTFGDLDGDGDLDLMVGCENGSLFYCENLAGKDKPAIFGPIQNYYGNIDVGQASCPFIYDLDGDGLSDLIVGERNGNINFFPNIGSLGYPKFAFDPNQPPNNNFLGKISTKEINTNTGYSSPFIFKIDDKLQLMTGTLNGGIHLYNNIENNLSGTFNQVTKTLGGLQDGQQTIPVLVELTGDKNLELVTGNYCGGLRIYNTQYKTGTTLSIDISSNEISIFPNPVHDNLSISYSKSDLISCEVSVIDLLGCTRLKKNLLLNIDSLSLDSLAQGAYFVVIKRGNTSVVKKIIKI